jgi:hypothetical protein
MITYTAGMNIKVWGDPNFNFQIIPGQHTETPGCQEETPSRHLENEAARLPSFS